MTHYTGTAANDVLTGSSGADSLDGGPGADTMSGLAGDDVYMVDDAADAVIENPGGGRDRINTTISLALPTDVEDIWLVGSADINGTGNGLDNVMWGNAGVNRLSGGAGADVLDGGAGADQLVGGTGDDTYWVDDAGDAVQEASGEGTDTVRSALAHYTLGAALENLVLLAGTGDASASGNLLDNVLTGNEGRNALDGGAGNDQLDGGAGADSMAGGSGDDSYTVDDAGDVVVEGDGEGVDTVTSTAAHYALPAGVENLVLGPWYGSTEARNGSGNALANQLLGNSGDNVLDGGGGDDALAGGNGNDVLTGGDGTDLFRISIGDSGIDTLTDLAAGERIEIGGLIFDPMAVVGTGDGSALAQGAVQLASTGGHSTLFIGVDAAPGADLRIELDGSYAAGNFSLQGFEIVYDTNHAPQVATPIADQQATPGQSFAFTVPADIFVDVDGDALSYSACVLDIDEGYLPLPAWLHFDAATRAFSGTPGSADIDEMFLVVSASDPAGARADDAFVLAVQAPTLDTSAPTVAFSDNTPGIANAAVQCWLDFSEPVSGLATDDFVVTGGAVTALSGSGAHYQLWLQPAAGSEGTMEWALRAAAVTDAAGNPNALQAAPAQAIDTRAPHLEAFVPGEAATGVDRAADLQLVFSEDIQRGQGSVVLADAAGLVIERFDIATSPRLHFAGPLLSVDPSADLAEGASYTLFVPDSAVTDGVGNAAAGWGQLSFVTQPPPNHPPSGLVGISGLATQGQTLSAWNTLADADGMGAVGYQWLADGLDIVGATGDHLELQQAQVGRLVTVRACYADARGAIEAVASAATAPVLNLNDAPMGTLAIVGKAVQGQRLQAAADLQDADGLGALHFQWRADGIDIAGATEAAFTLTKSQVGRAITLVARYTDGQGSPERVVSGPTASVQALDDTPPALGTFGAGQAADGWAVDASLELRFNEAVTRGSGSIVLQTAAGTVLATYNAATSNRLVFSGALLTIDPTTDLAPDTPHQLVLSPGCVLDLAGNAWATTLTLPFVTAASTHPTPGHDHLTGSAARDRIQGLAGNDAIDGGGDIDTAVYAVARAAGRLSAHPGGWTLDAGIDGVDELVGVERLQFTDCSLALDLAGNAGVVARILGAVFGPAEVANALYAGIGLYHLDRGLSAPELVQMAIDARLGSGASPTAVVELLYGNVMGQPPSADERDAFVALLESHAYTTASLGMLAADHALNLARIDLVGLSARGLDYLPWEAGAGPGQNSG